MWFKYNMFVLWKDGNLMLQKNSTQDICDSSTKQTSFKEFKKVQMHITCNQ